MEYKALKVMSIITAIISAIFTVMATTAHSVGMLPTLLAVFMGVCFDVCKFLFAVVALTGLIATFKFNGMQRAVCGVFAIALFAYSIYASQTFLTDQANKYKALMIENSDNVSTINQDKEILQKQYDVIQSELQTLQAQSEKNLSKNFITVNKNEILPKIEAKTAELKEISNKLQELDVSKVSFDDVLKSKGMSNFTVNLTEWLNSFPENKKKPLTPSGVDAMIQSYIAIVFELLAIILWWLQHHIKIHGRLANTSVQGNPNKNDVTNKVIDETALKQLMERYKDFPMEIDVNADNAKKDSPIGFKYSEPFANTSVQGNNAGNTEFVTKPFANTSVHDFTDDDLQIYWEYVQQHKNGNISPGYQRISSETGLNTEVCRKIKAYLERINAITVSGNKTIVLQDTLNFGLKVYDRVSG